MAYRGNNLLLMEQRRDALDRAQRQQEMQGIQQAMMVAEDIKNRQFDRQRQQAEVHGRLAEQLMKQREPFAQAPLEEAAKIGQMEAQANRKKILDQQEMERQKLAEKRGYQERREDVGFQRAKELRRIPRPRTSGGGFRDILKNSIKAANQEVTQRKGTLDWLRKSNTYGRPNGTPEQIKQAEQDWLTAQGKLNQLSSTADMYSAGKGGGALGSWIQSQRATGASGGQGAQPTTPVKPTPGQMLQPSVTEELPLEQYTDPVARQFEQRKRQDPIMLGIEQRGKEQKLAQAKEAMSRQQKEDLLRMEIEAKNFMIRDLSESEIRELATQYLEGDNEIKAQIDRIVDSIDRHSQYGGDKPITRKKWESALDRMFQQRQVAQGGATATPTATSQPKLMPVETTDSAIMRRAKQLGHM